MIEDNLATKHDLIELERNLLRDMRELEYRIIIKLGGLMAASIAVVATLVKVCHSGDAFRASASTALMDSK